MKKKQTETRFSWERIKAVVKKWLQLLLNPRFLLCFGIGWMITNGWAYLMLGAGILWDCAWALSLAGAYLALLWIPMTPEKIITVTIAVLLLRWLFPNDQKTLGVLREMREKARRSIKKQSQKRKKGRSVEPTE